MADIDYAEKSRRQETLHRLFQRWDLEHTGLIDAAALRDRGVLLISVWI